MPLFTRLVPWPNGRRLTSRVPALMIGNGADSPGRVRRRSFECEAINRPSPSVEQHHPGDVGCSIGWIRRAGQGEAAAFWRRNKRPVEVKLIECRADDVEYNETRSRREKAFYSVQRWIPAESNAGHHDNE